MKHSLPSRGTVLRVAVLALLSVLLGGWGSVGHKFINLKSIVHLPPAMQGLIEKAQLLSDSANVADARKSKDPSEGPKHFMDIDEYAEFATKSVSHNLDSLIAEYGTTKVYDVGISPWAAKAALDSMTERMRRQDWTRAWASAADLGHYVGDQHQPLHNCRNYDGQYTGNNGIHSRYESSMISTYQGELVIVPNGVSYVADPLTYIFNYVYQANSYTDSVLAGDTYAKAQAGGATSGSVYYSALWSRTKSFTILQMQRATQDLANLYYTAWLNAGSPPIPSVTTGAHVQESPAQAFELSQNYPNPFNPSTTIAFSVPGSGHIRLEVFDARGRLMATLLDGQVFGGFQSVRWDASTQPSGLYFSRLTLIAPSGTQVHTGKLLLLK